MHVRTLGVTTDEHAPPREVVVGLDVGTTGVKAVAFGVGSAWQRLALREYALDEPVPGWQVQDVATILHASAEALARCVAQVGGASVVAVSVSTAMHGLVALDAACDPITPLVTWADARAGREASELRRSGDALALHRDTGAPVHPMTPLVKLAWFARNDPGTCARARWWVGLKECVLYWLTGELVTELSSASGSGLLDMATRTWSPGATRVAGVAPGALARIVPTTTVLHLASGVAAQVGLEAGTPVVAGAGDGPLANLGTGAIAPGIAALSLGTSGAVRSVVRAPRVDAAGRLFCYALTDDSWVLGGAVSNGGIVVRWAADALGPEPPRSDDEILALAASAPPGCEGLVMLPYLLAERAPLWDPDVPGAYLGLRRHHGRAHLVRAAIEGVCLQLGSIVELLADTEPVRSVRATGGALRSPLWRDVLAASIGRPLRVVEDAGGSALGAATLALLALGRAPDLARARALLVGSGRDDDLPAPVAVDPALVEAAEATRSRLPSLLSAYGEVATLLGRNRHGGASPGEDRAPRQPDQRRSP